MARQKKVGQVVGSTAENGQLQLTWNSFQATHKRRGLSNADLSRLWKEYKAGTYMVPEEFLQTVVSGRAPNGTTADEARTTKDNPATSAGSAEMAPSKPPRRSRATTASSGSALSEIGTPLSHEVDSSTVALLPTTRAAAASPTPTTIHVSATTAAAAVAASVPLKVQTVTASHPQKLTRRPPSKPQQPAVQPSTQHAPHGLTPPADAAAVGRSQQSWSPVPAHSQPAGILGDPLLLAKPTACTEIPHLDLYGPVSEPAAACAPAGRRCRRGSGRGSSRRPQIDTSQPEAPVPAVAPAGHPSLTSAPPLAGPATAEPSAVEVEVDGKGPPELVEGAAADPWVRTEALQAAREPADCRQEAGATAATAVAEEAGVAAATAAEGFAGQGEDDAEGRDGTAAAHGSSSSQEQGLRRKLRRARRRRWSRASAAADGDAPHAAAAAVAGGGSSSSSVDISIIKSEDPGGGPAPGPLAAVQVGTAVGPEAGSNGGQEPIIALGRGAGVGAPEAVQLLDSTVSPPPLPCIHAQPQPHRSQPQDPEESPPKVAAQQHPLDDSGAQAVVDPDPDLDRDPHQDRDHGQRRCRARRSRTVARREDERPPGKTGAKGSGGDDSGNGAIAKGSGGDAGGDRGDDDRAALDAGSGSARTSNATLTSPSPRLEDEAAVAVAATAVDGAVAVRRDEKGRRASDPDVTTDGKLPQQEEEGPAANAWRSDQELASVSSSSSSSRGCCTKGRPADGAHDADAVKDEAAATAAEAPAATALVQTAESAAAAAASCPANGPAAAAAGPFSAGRQLGLSAVWRLAARLAGLVPRGGGGGGGGGGFAGGGTDAGLGGSATTTAAVWALCGGAAATSGGMSLDRSHDHGHDHGHDHDRGGSQSSEDSAGSLRTALEAVDDVEGGEQRHGREEHLGAAEPGQQPQPAEAAPQAEAIAEAERGSGKGGEEEEEVWASPAASCVSSRRVTSEEVASIATTTSVATTAAVVVHGRGVPSGGRGVRWLPEGRPGDAPGLVGSCYVDGGGGGGPGPQVAAMMVENYCAGQRESPTAEMQEQQQQQQLAAEAAADDEEEQEGQGVVEAQVPGPAAAAVGVEEEADLGEEGVRGGAEGTRPVAGGLEAPGGAPAGEDADTGCNGSDRTASVSLLCAPTAETATAASAVALENPTTVAAAEPAAAASGPATAAAAAVLRDTDAVEEEEDGPTSPVPCPSPPGLTSAAASPTSYSRCSPSTPLHSRYNLGAQPNPNPNHTPSHSHSQRSDVTAASAAASEAANLGTPTCTPQPECRLRDSAGAVGSAGGDSGGGEDEDGVGGDSELSAKEVAAGGLAAATATDYAATATATAIAVAAAAALGAPVTGVQAGPGHCATATALSSEAAAVDPATAASGRSDPGPREEHEGEQAEEKEEDADGGNGAGAGQEGCALRLRAGLLPPSPPGQLRRRQQQEEEEESLGWGQTAGEGSQRGEGQGQGRCCSAAVVAAASLLRAEAEPLAAAAAAAPLLAEPGGVRQRQRRRGRRRRSAGGATIHPNGLCRPSGGGGAASPTSPNQRALSTAASSASTAVVVGGGTAATTSPARSFTPTGRVWRIGEDSAAPQASTPGSPPRVKTQGRDDVSGGACGELEEGGPQEVGGAWAKEAGVEGEPPLPVPVSQHPQDPTRPRRRRQQQQLQPQEDAQGVPKINDGSSLTADNGNGNPVNAASASQHRRVRLPYHPGPRQATLDGFLDRPPLPQHQPSGSSRGGIGTCGDGSSCGIRSSSSSSSTFNTAEQDGRTVDGVAAPECRQRRSCRLASQLPPRAAGKMIPLFPPSEDDEEAAAAPPPGVEDVSDAVSELTTSCPLPPAAATESGRSDVVRGRRHKRSTKSLAKLPSTAPAMETLSLFAPGDWEGAANVEERGEAVSEPASPASPATSCAGGGGSGGGGAAATRKPAAAPGSRTKVISRQTALNTDTIAVPPSPPLQQPSQQLPASLQQYQALLQPSQQLQQPPQQQQQLRTPRVSTARTTTTTINTAVAAAGWPMDSRLLRERDLRDDDPLFAGFSRWALVRADQAVLAAARPPARPGIYEWGARAPGDTRVVAFYLGKAGGGRSRETLRSRFNKYATSTRVLLGPRESLVAVEKAVRPPTRREMAAAEKKKKKATAAAAAASAVGAAPSAGSGCRTMGEPRKAELWRRLQSRGFELYYRFRVCEGEVDAVAAERELHDLVNYAGCLVNNGSYRQLLLGPPGGAEAAHSRGGTSASGGLVRGPASLGSLRAPQPRITRSLSQSQGCSQSQSYSQSHSYSQSQSLSYSLDDYPVLRPELEWTGALNQLAVGAAAGTRGQQQLRRLWAAGTQLAAAAAAVPVSAVDVDSDADADAAELVAVV